MITNKCSYIANILGEEVFSTSLLFLGLSVFLSVSQYFNCLKLICL